MELSREDSTSAENDDNELLSSATNTVLLLLGLDLILRLEEDVVSSGKMNSSLEYFADDEDASRCPSFAAVAAAVRMGLIDDDLWWPRCRGRRGPVVGMGEKVDDVDEWARLTAAWAPVFIPTKVVGRRLHGGRGHLHGLGLGFHVDQRRSGLECTRQKRISY